MRFDSEKLYGFNFALLRVLMGVIFFSTTFSNLRKGLYGQGYREFLIYLSKDHPFSFYQVFLEDFAIPNWQILAKLQMVFEFALGFFLILGILTRLSAFLGFIFSLNLMFGTLGKDWIFTYVMMLSIFFVIFTSRAGRFYGLDKILLRKFGEKLVW
ncbi:MAG: DoxX family protein [Candidatus Methanofastidiosia archaeon]